MSPFAICSSHVHRFRLIPSLPLGNNAKIMKKGYLWIAIGVAMVVFDMAVKPIFSIPITSGFQFPIALLALLYGVLSLISARMVATHASLESDEIKQWGADLEKITPRIIELSEDGKSTEEIVELLESDTTIPADILIKYLYAMRQYLQGVAEDARIDARIDERRKMKP